MRLEIRGDFPARKLVGGKVEPNQIVAGKVLFVTITYKEHEKCPPQVAPIFFVDGQRVLPDDDFFVALALPETCAKNKSGEVVCITNHNFFPAQQNRAAALELAHCPRCGNLLIVFEDAPVPTMVPKPPPAWGVALLFLAVKTPVEFFELSINHVDIDL